MCETGTGQPVAEPHVSFDDDDKRRILLYHIAHVRACVCISGSIFTDPWRRRCPIAEDGCESVRSTKWDGDSRLFQKIDSCRYLPGCMAPFPLVRKFSVFASKISNISDFYFLFFFCPLISFSFSFYYFVSLHSAYVSSSSILRVLLLFLVPLFFFLFFFLSFIHSLLLLNFLVPVTSCHLTVTFCVSFLFRRSKANLSCTVDLCNPQYSKPFKVT